MKSLIAVLLFVSVFSVCAVSAEEMNQEQKEAMDLFLKLYSISATNKTQIYLLKEGVARIYIQRYALDRKLSMKSVLEELNGMVHLFADQQFGNKDGKGDAEEFQKFQDQTRDSAGFRALRLMMHEYLR